MTKQVELLSANNQEITEQINQIVSKFGVKVHHSKGLVDAERMEKLISLKKAILFSKDRIDKLTQKRRDLSQDVESLYTMVDQVRQEVACEEELAQEYVYEPSDPIYAPVYSHQGHSKGICIERTLLGFAVFSHIC